jgi:hypothetical protein
MLTLRYRRPTGSGLAIHEAFRLFGLIVGGLDRKC